MLHDSFLCMEPLHKFPRLSYRKPIKLMAWTPEFMELFNELKKAVTSSLVLALFGPSKPTYLNIDWRV